MRFNQILEKISADTRSKVSKEYETVHEKVATKTDYTGPVNQIDKLLSNKKIKIDDTLREKIQQSRDGIMEAIKNKDFKRAAELAKELKSIPEITKEFDYKDVLKMVDKRDVSYMALEQLLDKEITNKIKNLLQVDDLRSAPDAIKAKRLEIIAIIKTYKHIKNTNPELANQVMKELSDNVNAQLDTEIEYAKKKYMQIAEEKTMWAIDTVYTRTMDYLNNDIIKTYTEKAFDLEKTINNAITNIDNLKITGITKTVNMNIQISKIDVVGKQVDRMNKYLAEYNEIAKKHVERAKEWANKQLAKLKDKIVDRLGQNMKEWGKSALERIKF